MIFDDFETLRGRFFEDFPRVPRNHRFGIFLLFFDNSPGTRRNPSKYYFLQFPANREFYRVCRDGPMQVDVAKRHSSDPSHHNGENAAG